jgi:hypothetical protein
MNRAEADALVADVMAEHFARLRDELVARIDRAIDEKAIPPFVPPLVWTRGRHGAGTVVRHRNGVFMARRDTGAEPGTNEAWLPLLVGVAALDLRWKDERALLLAVELSDGTIVETERQMAVPIVRGYWDAEANYEPGDRVFRYGEWHACKPSQGIDPTAAGSEQAWVKVSGKNARGVSFSVDDEGTMFEGGREIGTLKPMVAGLFEKLTRGRT